MESADGNMSDAPTAAYPTAPQNSTEAPIKPEPVEEETSKPSESPAETKPPKSEEVNHVAPEGAAVIKSEPSVATSDTPASADTITAQAQPAPVISPYAAEEEKYWKIVTANPADFTSWTYLINVTEKEDKLDSLRKVYDTFLTEFPLCYGYWKKYADLELRHGNPQRNREVYERGIHAIPHSVDLWTHYCTHVAEKSDDLEEIRSLFERAATAVGNDYVAHMLWDKYIEFEISQEEYARVASLYQRILAHTLQPTDLDRYWDRYKQWSLTRPVADLLTADEAAAFEPEPNAPLEEPEKLEAEKRDRVIQAREQLYRLTIEETLKRRPFESGIKRPYFHIKPLDESQLSNWRRYLDFEEKEGGQARTIKLYERCLIACCNYPEFWLRYFKYAETIGDPALAEDILRRAAEIFLKSRAEIQYVYASHLEAVGKIQKARAVYERFLKTTPGLLDTILKFANFERRQGQLDTASALYESELAQLEGKHHTFLILHYCRFLAEVMRNASKARDYYEVAVSKHPDSKIAWQNYIAFEAAQPRGESECRVLSLYQRAVAADSKLSAEDKSDLWARYVEYVQDRGTSIKSLRAVEAAYKAASASLKDTSRKRTNDSDSKDSHRQNKSQRTSYSSSQSYSQPAQSSYSQAQPASQYQQPYSQAYQQSYPGYQQYPAASPSYPQPSTYPTQYAQPAAQTYQQGYAAQPAAYAAPQQSYPPAAYQQPAAAPAAYAQPAAGGYSQPAAYPASYYQQPPAGYAPPKAAGAAPPAAAPAPGYSAQGYYAYPAQ